MYSKVSVHTASTLINLMYEFEKPGTTTRSAVHAIPNIMKYLQFKICLETKTNRPHEIWYVACA